MMYRRTFCIPAAHFNDSGYSYLREAKKEAEEGGWKAAYQALLLAAIETHGHNFLIECVIDGDPPKDYPWLVDDRVLTETVESWFRGNLSLHPDLLAINQRATTENLAKRLAGVVLPLLPQHCVLKMTVHETPRISATVKERS
jgi:hypothetical protein